MLFRSLLLLTFSSRSQAVPGPRGEAVDKHRRQNHGHHGQGAEASPPLRAGRRADPHLHAHEEGRRGRGEGARRPGSPSLPRYREGSLDVGKGRECVVSALLVLDAELSTPSSSCPPGWPLRVFLSPLAGEDCLSAEAVCPFFKKSFYLFIYFWLRWVFVAARGLCLVEASGGYSSLRCACFSLRWLLSLRSMGFRHVGSVVVASGLSSCGSRALERRLSNCGSRA